MHWLYDVDIFNVGDVLFDCASFAVSAESTVFKKSRRVHQTLKYAVCETSVSKVSISWKQRIGQFLAFLIGNLSIQLFVLQALNFIFLHHVIPPRGRLVNTFPRG